MFGFPRTLKKFFDPVKPARQKKVSPTTSKRVNTQQAPQLAQSKLSRRGGEAATPVIERAWPFKAKQLSNRSNPMGQFLSGSFTNHAGTRSYKLYLPAVPAAAMVPSKTDSSQDQSRDRTKVSRLPLVVMLHGCMQNADDFSNGTGMNALGDQFQCYVLYPEQSTSANRNQCWNWFSRAHQVSGRGEPSLIADMTQHILQEYPIDRQKVFVAGLSAGGAMAATLAHLYPKLYAALGIHSGLPHGSADNLSSALAVMQTGIDIRDTSELPEQLTVEQPLIVIQGDQDTTVHPNNGNRLIDEFLRKNQTQSYDVDKVLHSGEPTINIQGRDYTVTTYSNSHNVKIAEYWQIHGGGHAWSGGNPSSNYTDPLGPNASLAMLLFFLASR